jgi:predicted transcriptional regulator
MVADSSTTTYLAPVITVAQIRAARALLGWKQGDLAKAAGISEISIKNIERGVTDPRASTLAAIQRAFDDAGLMFLEPGDIRDGSYGIRLKKPDQK